MREKDPYAPYEPEGGGFYSDGAYVAIPMQGASDEQHEILHLDPQEAYYTALLGRFERLRSILSTSPPLSAPPIDPAVRSLLGKPKPSPWKHALLKSQSTPMLLASLPHENVVFGIEVLESLLTMKNLSGGARHRLGAWTWGLLGRCRGVSEMDSEDVSVLRGLGKKSCALLRRLRAGEQLDGADEDVEITQKSSDNAGRDKINGDVCENDGENGKDDAVDDRLHRNESDGKDGKVESASAEIDPPPDRFPGHDAMCDSQIEGASLEEVRTRLLKGLSGADQVFIGDADDPPIEHESAEPAQVSDAHATLDMIVTLVGECYGQRDLLDARLAWEEL